LERLKRRPKLQMPKTEAVLDEAAVLEMAQVIGDAAVDEVTKTLKSSNAALEKLRKDVAHVAKGKGKGRKQKCGAKCWETVEMARCCLPDPPVPGCNISLETVWECRWRASYPRVVAPFELRVPFQGDDEDARRDALSVALRWIWDAHLIKTEGKVSCPWDLSLI
jgi:hypothetical protein